MEGNTISISNSWFLGTFYYKSGYLIFFIHRLLPNQTPSPQGSTALVPSRKTLISRILNLIENIQLSSSLSLPTRGALILTLILLGLSKGGGVFIENLVERGAEGDEQVLRYSLLFSYYLLLILYVLNNLRSDSITKILKHIAENLTSYFLYPFLAEELTPILIERYLKPVNCIFFKLCSSHTWALLRSTRYFHRFKKKKKVFPIPYPSTISRIGFEHSLYILYPPTSRQFPRMLSS